MKAGSQTSGKRKIRRAAILVCAALALAWFGAYPDVIGRAAGRIRHRFFTVQTDHWVDIPVAGSVCAVGGDTFYTFDGGTICALDPEGRLRWTQETALQAPVFESLRDQVLAYEPGESSLYLADRRGCSVIEVPAGADAAVPGPQGSVAVITAGSGYLTELKVFDRAGKPFRTEGFPDMAISNLAYLKNGTLALCGVSREGAWSLLLEDREIPLETAAVCDMAPWGAGLALWTAEGLLLFDETGAPAGTVSGRGSDWACGDAAALLVYEDGGWRLAICARDGTVTRSGRLPGRPLSLTVCKDFVCVLDRQCLRIYDERGALREELSSGAGAARILSWEDRLLLTGDGRILLHFHP